MSADGWPHAIERVVRRFCPLSFRKVLKSGEHAVGHNPNFVIVSTGRAGSTYTAHLLKQAGLKCSHEMFFTPAGFYRNLRYDGDSSWLAVPYLECDPRLAESVVHQVRNPLDVVSSLYGIGFFEPDNNNPFARFVRENFRVTGKPLLDCVRFWTEWNSRCEAVADKTYLFEELLEDPSVVFSSLGLRLDDEARNRLAVVGKQKVNARRRVEISLDEIPEGVEKKEMLELANKYG